MKNLSKEEVRTAEEIAYDTWRKLVNQNWSNVAGEIQAAIELYASQFKSKSEAVGWIKVKTEKDLPNENHLWGRGADLCCSHLP